MNAEYELNFIRDVFKKCFIRTSLFSLNDSMDVILDSWMSAIIGNATADITVQKNIGNVDDNTIYKFTTELKFKYMFMRVPILSEKNLLFIGPYLTAPLSQKEILEVGENLNLPPNKQNLLIEYYASLPTIPENDRIFSMIDAFCENIWQTQSISIKEINKNHTFLASSTLSSAQEDSTNEVFADMEKMEMRYSFENELIMAVTLGQQHKERMLLSAFNDKMFERRLQDPLRNGKNYCIIMNTLLRKAAEQGGVHPLYIDRMSSEFATKIELLKNTESISILMQEIFSSYCRLVRKHSTKQYSPIVKKTILIIVSDISAELSLHTLAEKQGISSGYLATIFKKETGKTISEFIRNKRISHAVHLLNTTDLQIQTIAMHCGIMDVQYFSKIFKKQLGKTPKEYREIAQRKIKK